MAEFIDWVDWTVTVEKPDGESLSFVVQGDLIEDALTNARLWAGSRRIIGCALRASSKEVQAGPVDTPTCRCGHSKGAHASPDSSGTSCLVQHCRCSRFEEVGGDGE